MITKSDPLYIIDHAAYHDVPLHLLLLKQAPAGTPLHVRLNHAVGTYETKAGQTVQAVLIEPVLAGNDILIPAGSTLTGTVTKVKKVGFGIVHENGGRWVLIR